MGRSYLFECPKCGYRARVSGGADRGLAFFVQTILCRDCKRLYDAVTRLATAEEAGWGPGRDLPRPALGRRVASGPPAFESVANRLPVSGGESFRWVEFKIRCPVSANHRVRSWKDPDKCPGCGAFLERSGLPFRIWE
jgi:hypothetical protein